MQAGGPGTWRQRSHVNGKKSICLQSSTLQCFPRSGNSGVPIEIRSHRLRKNGTKKGKKSQKQKSSYTRNQMEFPRKLELLRDWGIGCPELKLSNSAYRDQDRGIESLRISKKKSRWNWKSSRIPKIQN